MKYHIYITYILVHILVAVYTIEQRQVFPGQLILTPDERKVMDLSEYYSGYNLRFTKKSNQEWITIQKKLQFLNKNPLNQTLELVQCSIDKKYNGNFENQFACLDNKQVIHFGYMPDGEDKPYIYISYQIQMDNPEQVTLNCYDLEKVAVSVYLVDCSYSTQQFSPEIGIWFEIQTTGYTPKDFKIDQVKQYKINIAQYSTSFEERETVVLVKDELTYLLHVIRGKTDSFVEVYVYNAYASFQLLQVLDKFTFRLNSLIIQDIYIQDTNIYIACSVNGVIRILFRNAYSYDWSIYNPGVSITRIAVVSEYEIGIEQLTVILATKDKGLYEIDWTDLQSPYEINSYDLPKRLQLDAVKIDLSEKYIIVQTYEFSQSATVEAQEFLHIFRRGEKLLEHEYLRIELVKTQCPFYYNKLSHKLILFNQDSINTYQLLDASIIFKPQSNTIKDIHNVQFEIESCDSGICKQLQVQFNVKIVQFNDKNTYVLQQPIDIHPSIYLNYPGVEYISLINYVSGPGINFTLESKSLQNVDLLDVDTAEQKILKLRDPLKTLMKQKKTIFTKFEAASHQLTYDYYYMYFIQLEESQSVKPLYVQKCSETPVGLACDLLGIIQLQGTIKKLVITQEYIYIKEQSNILQIQVYDIKRLKSIYNITSIEIYDECTDLDIVKLRQQDLVLCTKTHKKQIEIIDSISQYIGQYDIIDKQTVGFRGFKPEYVTTSDIFPELIFVKSLSDILILNIAEYYQTKHTLISNISSVATQSEFEISISHSGLLIINTFNQKIELWDISYPHQPIFRTYLPLYDFMLSANDYKNGGFYDSTLHNDVIVILGSTKTNKVILCYHLNNQRSTHNILYQVIKLTEKSDTKVFIDSASTTYGHQYLIITTETQQQQTLWKIWDEPRLTIKSKFRNLNDQYEFQVLKIQYQNLDGKIQSFNINTTLWNSGGNITRTSIIPKPFIINLTSTDTDIYSINQFDYFNGHILEGFIHCDNNECQQPNAKVQIIPKIQLINKIKNFKNQQVQDIQLTTKYLLIQTTTKIYVYNSKKTTELLYIVDIGIQLPELTSTNQLKCIDLEIHQTELYGLSLCNNEDTRVGYIILISFLNHQPTIINYYKIVQPYLNKLVIQDDYIFILVHPHHQSSKILVYQLDISGERESYTLDQKDYELQLTSYSHIDAAVWDAPDFLPVDIKIQKIHQNKQYRLFITDAHFGIRYALIEFSSEEYTIIPGNINLQQYFINELQPKNQVEWLTLDITTIETEIYQVLITSKNFHHYELKIDLRQPKQQNPQIYIMQMYQMYGGYDVYDIVSTSKHFFGIITKRHQFDSTLQDALLIYDRTLVPSHKFNETYSRKQVIGALYYDTPTTHLNSNTDIQYTFLLQDLKDNTAKLWQSTWHPTYKLNEYIINNKIGVSVTNKNDIKSLSIVFKVHNEFKDNFITIPIQYVKIVTKNKIDRSKTGIIVISILVFLLVVGIGIQIYRTKQQQRFKRISFATTIPMINYDIHKE